AKEGRRVSGPDGARRADEPGRGEAARKRRRRPLRAYESPAQGAVEVPGQRARSRRDERREPLEHPGPRFRPEPPGPARPRGEGPAPARPRGDGPEGQEPERARTREMHRDRRRSPRIVLAVDRQPPGTERQDRESLARVLSDPGDIPGAEIGHVPEEHLRAGA